MDAGSGKAPVRAIVTVRDATPQDCAEIHRMLEALAEYERAPGAVKVTAETLRRDGFGADPKFAAAIAELDGAPVGFTLWTYNYSTWEGRRGLFLEDIFVEDRARRFGIGRALMADLARRALAQGFGRIDLNVLTWNPAREFYQSVGFKHIEDWAPYRIRGEALEKLAGL